MLLLNECGGGGGARIVRPHPNFRLFLALDPRWVGGVAGRLQGGDQADESGWWMQVVAGADARHQLAVLLLLPRCVVSRDTSLAHCIH